jgi:hypothetical protein
LRIVFLTPGGTALRGKGSSPSMGPSATELDWQMQRANPG